MAKGALKGFRVGGVDLERKVGHALDGLDCRVQHGRLVEPRDAYVDVKHMRPGFRLGDGLAQHIRCIPLDECSFKLLLARRVDALADDYRVGERNLHDARAGGYRGKRLTARDIARLQFDRLQRGDVRGRSAAASADNACASLDECGDVCGELVRAYGEDCFAVHDLRHPGVWLDGYRKGGTLG